MSIWPEEDSSPDLADRFDEALEALWRGNGAQFDRLLDSGDPATSGLGEVFSGTVDGDAALALGPPQTPRVEGYDVIGEIGRGGMGVVYKACQLSTKRFVALKVMRAGSSASESARKRFQREVELTARFQHPGIVRVLEGGETCTGQPYYTMDYVDGVPLNDWVSRSDPDVGAILRRFQTLCEVVDHAHRHDVVHSDLKPGNVLVDAEGNPHILDFGLARAMKGGPADDAASSMDSLGGTLPYLSPEQAAGTLQEIDSRTDVWALGAMLFETLSGRLPFGTGCSRSEVRRRICSDSPTPPSSLSSDVDCELDTIILKALQKDKAARYQSAQEMGEELGRYLRGEPILAKGRSPAYVLRKKLAKHGGVWGLALAVIAVASVAVFTVSWTFRHRELSMARRNVMLLQRDSEGGADVRERAGRVCNKYPELPEACLVRAQTLLRMRVGPEVAGSGGWGEKTMEVLQSRLGRDQSSRWAYYFLMAEICRDMADHAEAARLESTAQSEFPDTADAWYLRSFTTVKFDDAMRYTRRAVEGDPGHALAWERLANAHQQVGDFDEALIAAQEATDHGADPYWATMFQSHILTKLHHYGEAIGLYDRAVELGAGSTDVYRSRALPYLCLREYNLAIEDYTRVLRATNLGHPSSWTRFYRATPLWITGRREQAADDYNAFRSIHGEGTYADARLFLVWADEARFLAAQDREIEAEDIRRRAAEVLQRGVASTTAKPWLRNILRCLQGELAPDQLVRAADPTNVEQVCESYYYAGESCLLRGQAAPARKWFEMCLETNLVFDSDCWPPAPMNEYHLAIWRLESILPDRAHEPQTSRE